MNPGFVGVENVCPGLTGEDGRSSQPIPTAETPVIGARSWGPSGELGPGYGVEN